MALAFVVVLLTGAVGTSWWTARAEDVRHGTDLLTTQELAARHGISVDLVAVTAAQGLVELRYQVVDPDTATRILHDSELAPTLVDEATGATLRMSAPPHQHGGGVLRWGGTYFFLMANSHNALRQGSAVTLVVGDSRVEHIRVQG